MGALLRVEWIKAMRMRSTYIAFTAAAVLILLVQLGVYFGADESRFFAFLQMAGLPTSLLMNGFVGTRIAMEVGFMLLIAPMTIMIFARMIAGEDSRGTLRLILVRPVSRPALMTAKFLIGAAGSMLLMGFFLSLSYGVGLALYGPQDSITVGHPRELDPREYAGEDAATEQYTRANYRQADEERRRRMREQWREFRTNRNEAIARFVIDPDRQLRRLVLAWAMTSWALLSLGSLALFFSTINRHPITAMALTIGTYFTILILQGLASAENVIPLFQNLEPYLLTTGMDFWRGCFSHEIEWGEVRHDALLLGAYTVGFFGLSQLIFWRRDITS